MSVLADQSSTDTGTDGFPTYKNVKASDLLYMPATLIDPNNPGDKVNEEGKVKVAMKHAFAKLDITVNVGTALGGNETTNPITSLTVDGIRLKATFAPAAGTPLTIADADNAPPPSPPETTATPPPPASTPTSTPKPKPSTSASCCRNPSPRSNSK